jgi:hypothetical protein
MGRRCAAAATDGDARPVGSCEADDIVAPHHPQVAAASSTSEEQLEQRINRRKSYRRQASRPG